jgi:hypothetical protein
MSTSAATEAIAYYRTSSAANVGPGNDSLRRQEAAVLAYARGRGIRLVDTFYDAAVSGADPIEDRPGFLAMLARIAGNGVRIILVRDGEPLRPRSCGARDGMALPAGPGHRTRRRRQPRGVPLRYADRRPGAPGAGRGQPVRKGRPDRRGWIPLR